jgi:Ca-activated chloride channel family protein
MTTTLSARTDRSLVRAGAHSTRYVLIEATAPTPEAERAATRPSVNVAFVLDRSGSMAGAKIAMARRAVERAIAGLAPEDRFAVVTYDTQVDLIAPSQPATAEHKHAATLALQAVEARDMTDLHGGWTRGADAIRDHLSADGVNRVLLLTDGLANVGVTDPDTLAHVARDLRASGIGTSTFGVGADFNEVLLAAIADAGGGHFYFIEHPQQIPDFITSELGELLAVVAREVRVDVTHHPALTIEPLSPIAGAAAAPGLVQLAIGDLVAGQKVEIVLRVRFPSVDEGAQTTAFFTIADRDGSLKADGCTLTWTHASHAANDAQPRDRDVDRAVAQVHAARARLEAVRLNRDGDFDRARRALRGVAQRIDGYAGDDLALREVSAALIAEESAFAAPMPEYDRKRRHFASANVQRSRNVEGQARR